MKKIGSLFVFIVVIWFIWPLFQPGYIPTHDGEFSIIRIWQFSKMLAAGQIFPRWAPDLNSGYGVPFFTFYYPLPYYIGSLFYNVGFSFVDSLKMTLALSYVGAALFCFLWLKKLFSAPAAIIGTLLSLSVPYWFVNLYVRGSIGETIATLTFFAGLSAVEHKKPKLLAFACGALILSHNIAALILLPILAGYILLRRKEFFWSVLLGLGVSAFFWIPAIIEGKFVLGLSNFDFRDHFVQFAQLLIPSWGTGFSRPGWPADEMSQQLGVGILLLLVTTFFLVRTERNKEWRRLVALWSSLGLLAIFLMLEASLPVWEFFRPMRFVQYPWRFLMVFISLAAFLGGYVADRVRWLALMLAILSVTFAIPYVRPVRYPIRSDQYYLSRREFTDGTTTVGNSFSTVWLPWQKDRAKQTIELVTGQATIAPLEQKPTEYTLHIDGLTQSSLRANISYYPGWVVYIDGAKKSVDELNGRIQFSVSPGRHDVILRLEETIARRISNIVSIVSLFWLLVSAILDQRYAYRYRHHSASNRP